MKDSTEVHLGVDLGASSGRVLAGLCDGHSLRLQELNRFDNGPVVANDRLYWDVLGQWQHIQDGLQMAALEFGDRVRSVGVDTWGVDYALLGPGDELLGNPYHYRDRRTVGCMEWAFQEIGREEIFAETGLQFMELNTLYQLLAMRAGNPRLLDAAEAFLMMPDLFHWLLTGEKANELTNATTTQLYNPREGNWSQLLLERFDLPSDIFLKVASPGSTLGQLRSALAATTGLGPIEVILPGTHDTASAVMAVPTSRVASHAPDWCYLSSGTWSLLGIETPAPIIHSKCRELNFTNEGGVGNTVRVLKNIAGLWLIQECRRVWQTAGRTFEWTQLVELASKAPPLVSLINPDAGEFVAPQEMPAAICSFCERTGQVVPATEGAVLRAAFDSLAMRYRMVIGWLEELTGGPIATIHVVGGGVQNQLLCQITADACNRLVVAGPVEATAIGNVMMQAVAAGTISSITEARQVVRRSFPVVQYEPVNPERWDEAYERFVRLTD